MYSSSNKPTDRPTAITSSKITTPVILLEPCSNRYDSQLLPKVARALSSNRDREGS